MQYKRIAVYDTIPKECETTVEALRECFDRRSQQIKICAFTESHSFLLDFRDNHYDMAFLAMNSPVDLNAARGAGQMDLSCPLFFVSRNGDYSLEGYRLSILDYLLKPVTCEYIHKAVSRIDTEFGRERKRKNLACCFDKTSHRISR